MREHYDVGVVGCWWGANYGSVLNGYAIYKTLKSFDLSVLMINKHNATENDWEIVGTHNERFIKKFYAPEEVSPIIPFTKLNELNDICDTFLTGSDQIWNYGINRIFDMVFMLNFVNDEKKKISFGTSFGHEDDGTPKDRIPEVTRLLHRYDAISVREPSGADICSSKYGVKAKVVIEPVFCLTKEQYCELADSSSLKTDEPYILTYILDPTPEKREAIIKYGELSGKKVINVLDGDPRVYDKNKLLLDLPNTMGKIGAEDLMKLYKDADFVITDSFHGTAFSLIFNKPFLTISNLRRGAVRFPELLEKYGLLDRLVKDPKQIPVNENYFNEIDYDPINEMIGKERERSLEWLKTALETPKDKLNGVVLPTNNIQRNLDMKMCMGCSACVNTCPKGALNLKPDEHGYYRSAIDYDKCIDCGLCTKVCPALNLPENNNSKAPELYEFIASKDDVLWKSSSGGIFPLLANEAFKMGGVVVGAAWRDDFTVEHIMINSIDDIYKLQKSKYLQSWLGNGIYTKIKEKLERGVFVLFSGCPCQVTGLKAFLKKDYDNLILIDLLCGNAPSSLFFKKYIEEDFPVGLEKYEFRHKVRGWTSDCTTTTTTNGVVSVRRGAKQDNYQRVYHNHAMCPPHCEKCRYQAVPRFGDITIGDFWGIENKDKTNTTKNGTSAVLVNNEKGKRFFFKVPADEIYVRENVPLNWLGGNGYAINGSHNYCSPKRDLFYEAITTMPFSEAVTYALKPNHGVYPKTPIFGYKPSDLHFSFDNKIWEEHYINGAMVLSTKEASPKPGNFCTLPLNQCLEMKKYKLKIKFKLFTEDTAMNFHIKDSGSRVYQIIYTHKVTKDNYGKWIEIEKEFTPDCDFYDEFMIGAAQLRGENRSIFFDYIRIEEM